jgi:hypothetical protein
MARDHVTRLGVDGRIILKWILDKQGVEWFYLLRDRDQWRDVVKTAMNIRIP